MATSLCVCVDQLLSRLISTVNVASRGFGIRTRLVRAVHNCLSNFALESLED